MGPNRIQTSSAEEFDFAVKVLVFLADSGHVNPWYVKQAIEAVATKQRTPARVVDSVRGAIVAAANCGVDEKISLDSPPISG